MADEDGSVLRTPHTADNTQPRTDVSAGDAKLEGRPDAGDPDDASYTVPSPDSPSGNRQGVLLSQPATLTHGP